MPDEYEWRVDAETLGGGLRLSVFDGNNAVTFEEYFYFLESNPEFRGWYTALLAQSDFEAFFWEHPPLTMDTWQDPAEFVLMDAPSLARFPPDAWSFASHFEGNDDLVRIFPNLGRDAILVAPRLMEDDAVYPHLGVFLRGAPVDQVHALWVSTARAVREQLGDAPLWVSTAGMGIAWLHIRLDSWPKYYRFDPYKIS